MADTMKRQKYIIWTAVLSVLIGIFTACDDDTTSSEIEVSEDIDAIKKLVNSGSLLLTTEQKSNKYYFYFETDTLIIPSTDITQLTSDTDNWKTTLLFADNTTISIPTLGKSLHLTDKNIKVNPTGYAPLSAQLTLSLPVDGYLKVCVKGKQDRKVDLSHTFKKYGSNFQEYVHGFYENHKNTLYVTMTDKQGRERITDSLQVSIPDLMFHTILPKIATVITQPEKMEPGMTLVNFLGDNEYDTHRPFMIDCYGDVRWALILKDHPDMKITAHTGLKRMKNGNFFCGDAKTSRLIEFDMVGTFINSWNLRDKGYTFHHEVIEIPNGHLIAAVSKDASIDQNGNTTIFDYIVEIDNESGTVVTEWDLNKSLDPTRETLIPAGDISATPGNWAHNNAVSYSPNDDCIIVSCRFQGIAKLTRQNQLKWLISPHKGWKKQSVLLAPLDRNGERITDSQVINGEKAGSDFDWSWGPHNPVLMPNGHLLVFDNGFHRHYGNTDLFNEGGYSRAVEYKIDETKQHIQEVWQYGKERGRSCFSIAVSGVQYLPETDHVLFCPGLGTPNSNGVGGKVIEVDYATREVIYEVELSVPNYLAFHRASRIQLYPENF